MTTAKRLWTLMSIACFPVVVDAQPLAGDSQFPLLNEIRWDMKTDEIKNLFDSRKSPLQVTDSTLVFQARPFGLSARARVHIDRGSRLPRMIEIGFEETPEGIRDTLINHFTKRTGKPPLITTKEKSAVIFTVKIEVALWRSENEIVNVMTMTSGSTIHGISVLITKAAPGPKS